MIKPVKYTTLATACALAVACGGDPEYKIFWNHEDIDPNQKSAGFIDTADLDGDGIKEVVLSTLVEEGTPGIGSTKGALRIYKRNESGWDERIVISTAEGMGFINKPQVMDLNEDAIPDILVQQGFIMTGGGSYQWLEGPDYDTLKAVTPETTLDNSDGFFWHLTEQVDLDGDGRLDLVTTSAKTQDVPEPQVRFEWYRNLGAGNYEQHILPVQVGGVALTSHDVDRDGDLDFIFPQFFTRPALVWVEQVSKPSAFNDWAGEWQVHSIDDTTGLGYWTVMDDIDDDGTLELVYGNHNNIKNPELVDAAGDPIPSGLYYFEIPANPMSSPWPKVTIDEGYPVDTFDFGKPASQGSPGIFAVGDVNNDGRSDLVVPGDGANNLFFLEQQADGSFTRSVIAEGVMYGMAKITDIENDGAVEVVAAMHNAPLNAGEVLKKKPGNLRIYWP
ncbi:MAG: VCBS repeat-containing protein [Ketobacteraceae bacterium]|nr:VCBS repeat-containing protein [Ketobacteraceae bacterium]